MATLRSLFDLSNYQSGADRNDEIERMIREGIITPFERDLAEGGTERGWNIDWSKTPTIAGTDAHIGDDGPGGIWRPTGGHNEHLNQAGVIDDPNWGQVTQSGNIKQEGPGLFDYLSLAALGYIAGGAAGLYGAPGASAGTGIGTTAGGASDLALGMSNLASSPTAGLSFGTDGLTGASALATPASLSVAPLATAAPAPTALAAAGLLNGSSGLTLADVGRAMRQISQIGNLLGGGQQGGGLLGGGVGGGGVHGGRQDPFSFVKLMRSYYGLA